MVAKKFHYIYSWWDPRTGLPIYIGKGTQNPTKLDPEFNRAYYIVRGGGNQFLKRVIDKIEKSNLKVVVEIFHEKFFNEEKAFAEEKHLIKKIGRRDLGKGPLLNLTDGGEGVCGHIITESHRLKISETLRTPKHRSRASKQLAKKMKDPEFYAKMIAGVTKSITSPSVRTKIDSPENRANLSKTLKSTRQRDDFYGKRYTSANNVRAIKRMRALNTPENRQLASERMKKLNEIRWSKKNRTKSLVTLAEARKYIPRQKAA